MATRKEQLAAVGFARRRVLGAVLRPDAADPDEGAPRPLRTLFGASIVAVVALGAAVVAGILDPQPADDWRRGLITDEAGVSYVLLGGKLHVVANATSAKLILGATAKSSVQSDKTLDPLKQGQGPAIGIADVPETPPKPAALGLKDWSVCVTATGRTVVEVGYPAATGTLTGAAALLAQDDTGQQWVVADGMKYKVVDRASVGAAFAAQTVKPRHVPGPWLAGLPAGDPLGVPTISGRFGSALTRPAPPGFNRVGMFGRSTASDGTPVYYLVSGEGLATVSQTMYELYKRDPRLATFKFTETVLPAAKVTPDMLAAGALTLTWPIEPPKFSAATQDPGSSTLCAAFDGTYDPQNRAHIAVSVSAAPPHPLPAEGAPAVAVVPGRAALVRESGTDAAAATTYLLTDTGTRYQLVGPAANLLGYQGEPSSAIPAAWLKLVPIGPALDPAQAAQPVSATTSTQPMQPMQPIQPIQVGRTH